MEENNHAAEKKYLRDNKHAIPNMHFAKGWERIEGGNLIKLAIVSGTQDYFSELK